MSETLTIGTRGSDLALWQAHFVQERLLALDPSLTVELRIIKTLGDAVLDSSLPAIGGQGLFTKEIDRSLLKGEADIAVHSMKDIPTVIPEELVIAAVTEREDVRDVFVSHPSSPRRTFAQLPNGATIATGSLRRKAQLLHARPDLRIADVRGNLSTRLRKLESSRWDGMVLTKAGMTRLGLLERIADVLPLDLMLPAVGQGALGIEIRKGDGRVERFVGALSHRSTALCVGAERTFLGRLEGGCQVPIGAHAVVLGDVMELTGMVASLDGRRVIRGTRTGPFSDAEDIGSRLAEDLLHRGADEILRELRALRPPESRP